MATLGAARLGVECHVDEDDVGRDDVAFTHRERTVRASEFADRGGSVVVGNSKVTFTLACPDCARLSGGAATRSAPLASMASVEGAWATGALVGFAMASVVVAAVAVRASRKDAAVPAEGSGDAAVLAAAKGPGTFNAQIGGVAGRPHAGSFVAVSVNPLAEA